eukprot:6483497-Amphidinium_carterae.2
MAGGTLRTSMTKWNSKLRCILHLLKFSYLAHAVEEHASASGTQALAIPDMGKQPKKGAPEEDR